MIRPLSLSLVLAAGLGLCACAQPPAPTTQSYIDVARADPVAQASEVEPGRILQVKPVSGSSFIYVVQRLRDDSVIEVDQTDAQPLPAGLRVSIRYGSPVRIEAAPTTPDLG
jgi:hypothetical protein